MHIPVSTYRVQLHQNFSFEELKGIIDYLDELGITTIYAAPIGKATPGSMHGYDVTDPNKINPEVGNKKDLEEIADLLTSRGMQWLQDIVPNHMAFNDHNTRLMDVLERGPVSPYYSYFDINWNHADPSLKDKVMVPFLGKSLQECVAGKELQIILSEKGFSVRYFDSSYPLNHTLFAILRKQDVVLSSKTQQLLELYEKGLLEKSELSSWRSKRIEMASELLSQENTRQEIESVLTIINERDDLLIKILESQFYSLTFWKETDKKINYRRFFTVNSLICLRMEDEAVFNEYHTLIHRLYQKGIIQGVRIDHIDGLNDPAEYLHRLRNLLGEDCFIVAEKILEGNEEIPAHWPLQGTSGYEFLSYVNKLLTDRHGSSRLYQFYEQLVPNLPPYDQLVLENKKLILERHMAGELDNIFDYLISLDLVRTNDLSKLKRALALVMLCLPVYRIYPDSLPLNGTDRRSMEEAFTMARSLEEGYEEELSLLESLCFNEEQSSDRSANILRFLRRLMQFTGPLTAKGVEDTTFYIYNPLISHDEVGDAPAALGIPIQEFHKKMIKRQLNNPLSLNATSTHDTKRGEDARMRLNVLSELPEEWIEKVTEWRTLNASAKVVVDDHAAPAVNDEYFIYQSVLGGFPEDRRVDPGWVERLQEYIVKVVREAKVISNWENPHIAYEDACTSFIEKILATDSGFLKSFVPFFNRVNAVASIHSVSQAVIKITAPGIPDIYQGCELWDLSYVDPDNRRPVDYEKRKQLLDLLKSASETGWPEVGKLFQQHQFTGITKLFATWKALGYRKQMKELFAKGSYLPLPLLAHGSLAVSYARYHRDQWCIVVIPFNFSRKKESNTVELTENFISLPANAPKRWRNIFTNAIIDLTEDKIPLQELIKDFPVAVLNGE